MLRRFVVLTLLASVLVVAPAGEASACTCMQPDPTRQLMHSDAAVIASLVEAPPTHEYIEDAVWVFEVETSLKGGLSGRIEVLGPNQGSTCGFEMAVGSSRGLFLHRKGDDLLGGLCSTISAEAMRGVLHPLLPVAYGEPVFLLSGRESDGDRVLASLNASGGVTAYAENGGMDSMCPGSQLFLEIRARKVLVRRTTHLGVIDRHPVDVGKKSSITAVACTDRSGGAVVAVTTKGDERSTRIIEVPSGRVLVERPGGVTHLRRNHAVVAGPTIELIDLSNGETTPLHVTKPARSVLEPPPQAAISVSPSGRHVVVVETRFDADENRGVSTLNVYEVHPKLKAATVDLDGRHPIVRTWLDETTAALVVLGTDHEVRSWLALDTRTLETRRLQPFGRRGKSVGYGIASVVGARLIFHDATGDRTVLRTLPDNSYELVSVLDSEAELRSDSPPADGFWLQDLIRQSVTVGKSILLR